MPLKQPTRRARGSLVLDPHLNRQGESLPVVIFAGSLLIVLLLAGWIFWPAARTKPTDRHPAETTGAAMTIESKPQIPAGEPLLVFCAAALKSPLEKAANQFEAETGVPVTLQFGASQTLLVNLELSKTGDLYIPADDSYITLAREKQLLAEVAPLAVMRPVLAVRRGNPLEIRALDQLLQPTVRLAQANPDAAAIGKVVRGALQETGRWEEVRERTTVFTSTVQEVASALQIGSVDAGFLWSPMLVDFADLEEVAILELKSRSATVTAGVISTSPQRERARQFLNFLAAKEQGGRIFSERGYAPPQSARSPAE